MPVSGFSCFHSAGVAFSHEASAPEVGSLMLDLNPRVSTVLSRDPSRLLHEIGQVPAISGHDKRLCRVTVLLHEMCRTFRDGTHTRHLYHTKRARSRQPGSRGLSIYWHELVVNFTRQARPQILDVSGCF